jgi:ribonuclease J
MSRVIRRATSCRACTRIAVPVHGELRHLIEHAALARSCQVPQALVVENGAVVRLGPGGDASIIDRVPVGRLGLDGNRLVPLDSNSLRERRRMVNQGMAVITLVADAVGTLKADPVVSLHGLADGEQEAELILSVSELVRFAIEQMPKGAKRDDAAIRETARLAARKKLNAELKHKPVTEVHLVRV